MVYDTASGAVTTPDPLLGQPSGLAFAPSGPWLAVASGGSVTVVDALASNGAGQGAAAGVSVSDPYHLSTPPSGAQRVTWSAPITRFGISGVVSPSKGVVTLLAGITNPPTSTAPPSTTSTSTTVASLPELYVETGAMLGFLFPSGSFPDRIQLDNHDYIGNISWSSEVPPVAKATGSLENDDCVPDCASGTYHSAPVTLTASQPEHCTAQVFDSSSGNQMPEQAYVFNRLTATDSAGQPASSTVFQGACS